MKLFKIRGGVHPDDCKSLSAKSPIETLPMPPLLHLPIQQHIGAEAEPVVHRGDRVLKGDLLAKGGGAISAPVHAPTSGVIKRVGKYIAPHPSGLPMQTITLEPDGLDEWCDLGEPVNPEELTQEEIAQKVADSGVVGMGGATFPAAVKLSLYKNYSLHTLVINGAECEPYLTSDDQLMQSSPETIIDGIRIMLRALGIKRALLAIEANKPEAQAVLQSHLDGQEMITLVNVPTLYPMGSEKHLIQTLTGEETPAGKLSADIGIVVHNVATAHAVHEAVRYGRPLIQRVVTVSGGAIKQPKNLLVPIGTPTQALIDYCDGFSETPDRMISGGPMMGQPIRDLKVPIVKGGNGVIALTKKESSANEEQPCIRCGSCVSVCPCGLVPMALSSRIRHREFEAALDFGLMDCLSCGSCAYTCPSQIPLVHYFQYAKGELKARQQEQQKQERTKQLAEARKIRQEAAKKAKREAMMRRKKESEAKKKAAAEAEEGAAKTEPAEQGTKESVERVA